ncbi:SusC/RagA family TonB-linked outer membrane protein [Neolewinella persica]|uniref:SusC/RagA family TonB-linked outer membrane protein n=1 Tax=Neolewinella persica TaxID=70998 RepID=UPI00039F3858|nr:SusC/RagA family TonB-linked outer membrane protein [Neolewinella persica]
MPQSIRYFLGGLFLLLGCSAAVMAQRTITGSVTDSQREELIGVSIYVAGNTGVGTLSDLDGSYSLVVPDNAKQLVFSYLGFKKQFVDINKRDKINVTLESDAELLEEVVVVAFGEAKKSDVIGASDQISSRQLENLSVPSFDQALAGQVAGLQVRTGSGRPDAGAELLVRGIGTTGNNAPLIVVDGVPYGTYNNSEQDNFLSLFNPNDIESINVIRDASGKALYGARAGNGLILITTKKGRAGKPTITVNSYSGLSVIPDFEKPDILNATELATFLRERIEDDALNRGVDPVIPDNLADPSIYGEGTNWFDLVTRDGVTNNYDISVRGGNEKTTYNVSVGHFRTQGVVTNTGLKRYNFRANLDSELNDWLKFGITIAPSQTVNNSGSTDPGQGQFSAFHVLQVARWADPTGVAYDENGDLTTTTQGELLPFFQANPLYRLLNEKNSSVNRQVNSQMRLTVKLPFNLQLKQTVAANLIFNRGNSFTPGSVVGGGLTPANTNPPSNSGVSTRRREEFRLLSETTLNFNKKVGKHSIDLLTGYTAEYYELQRFQIGNNFIINEDFQLFNSNNVFQFNPEDLNNPTLDTPLPRFYINGNEERRERTLIGIIGRLTYDFDKKYYVTASVRRDASSRFSAARRNAIFPALGLAWRASNEPWFPKSNILSNLRFELSVGETGSQQVDESFYQGAVSRNDYTFGGLNAVGFQVNRLPNNNLQWETIKQTDIGIDLGFFKDRLNVKTVFYRARNTDLLFGNPLPDITGFDSQISNLGEIKNEGIEVSIDAKPIVKSDFVWRLSANVSTNRNEIVQIGTENVPIFQTPAGNGARISRTFVGGPVGQYYGLQLLGLYTPEMIDDPNVPKYPGAVVGAPFYLDGDGDGNLEVAEDYVFLGNPLPDLNYGFSSFVTWKNWGLRINANGEVGGLIFDLRREIELNTDGVFNVRREVLNRYRPGSDDFSLRAPTTVTASPSQRYRTPTSAGVVDGTFLKISNIKLEYSFADLVSKKEFLNGLMVYGSVQNALVFSKFRGNPEVKRAGNPFERNVAYSSYPITRTFTLGFAMQL